jgi:nucleolar GTP-binding protein
MGFKQGFYIPKVEELIDNAFQKARTEAEKVIENDLARKVIEKEKLRVRIAAEDITSTLKNIANRFPNISELNPLYKALLTNSLHIVKLKKALSHLNSSARTIEELKTKYLMQMTRMHRSEIGKIRNEFYGRLVSVTKRCKASLESVKEGMKAIAAIPKIRNLPTVLLIGTPNTGKSTFLSSVTNANVEIKNYPFTTKRIQVGKITEKYIDFQILDSPGLLDRTEEKQNPIEKQTTIALKTIADSLIFIIDVHEDLQSQLNVLKRYKTIIAKKPYFIVLNKIDLIEKSELVEAELNLKNILPKKTTIFKTSLNNLDEKTLKEMKQEIYSQNKDWYVKKGKEKIKFDLGI